MLHTIIFSVLIGILVSAPMGPMGLLCVQRTLVKGRAAGLISGLGIALSDIIYATLTLVGMTYIDSFIEHNRDILVLIGSVILAVFGFFIFKSNPIIKARTKEKENLLMRDFGRYFIKQHGKSFISAFLLTLSNISIIFLYLGLFSQFNVLEITDKTEWGYALIILCVLLGCICWWYFISFFVNKLRKYFNIRGLKIFNQVIGVILILCGTAGMLRYFILL